MPRPSAGYVIERRWSDGETVSYGAQVRAYGRYEKITFGTNKQGWNRRRAELEAERIVQQIERGTWVPPRLEPCPDRLEDAMGALAVPFDGPFRGVGGRSARFLKRARPQRTFLEVDEFHSLLDAAAQLEAEAPSNRQGLGRRAMIATLGLAGFRIGEMMDLLVSQVDLQRSRFKLA